MFKNVQKTPPSIFFEGEKWDTLLPYFGLRLKSLFSEKNSLCSTPNNRILKGVQKLLQEYNFYSLNCQAVILRPTKILLGLVFQSVAENCNF